MAQATVQPRLAGRSPVEWAVDRVWRFFCSVRAAIYEMAVLALLVLIGTLRGSDAPQWLADAIPATAPLVRRWYAWDVFHSLPFMALLTLLSVAITICTINRAPGIWRTIARPTVPTTHGFLRSAEPSAVIQSDASTVDLTDGLTATLRAKRYRVLTEQRGAEMHLYADKHRYAKLGTFPFHLALILILVGGIVGARYGFRETEFVIPEGSVREVGHGTGLSVELRGFTDTYRENGMPNEYRSDVVLRKNGEPVEEGPITVNHPMTHGDVVLYQASFGQAVSLRVTDAAGNLLYDDAIPLGLYRSTTNSDAPAGLLDLPQAGTRLHVIAPDENLANSPELDTLQLRSGEMFVEVRALGPNASGTLPGARVRQGETISLAGLNVEFVRERRFALLQVARNPGIPIFFAATLLLVGGLAITFYFPHRRIRGIVGAAPGGGSRAHLAPLAKRDWSGQRDFHRVLESVEQRLQIAPQLLGSRDALSEGSRAT